MARKLLGTAEVRKTRVGGSVPPGQIEVRLREVVDGRKRIWVERLSLDEYQRRIRLVSPDACR